MNSRFILFNLKGFVSILDTQAAIFVWDQLFMQFWNSSVMEDFCLALLFLLKDKFMGTNDYSDMKQVPTSAVQIS